MPRLAVALAADFNTTLSGPSGVPSDKFYYANACPWLVQRGWCARAARALNPLSPSIGGATPPV